jgi:hypothetical protein
MYKGEYASPGVQSGETKAFSSNYGAAGQTNALGSPSQGAGQMSSAPTNQGAPDYSIMGQLKMYEEDKKNRQARIDAKRQAGQPAQNNPYMNPLGGSSNTPAMDPGSLMSSLNNFFNQRQEAQQNAFGSAMDTSGYRNFNRLSQSQQDRVTSQYNKNLESTTTGTVNENERANAPLAFK